VVGDCDIESPIPIKVCHCEIHRILATRDAAGWDKLRFAVTEKDGELRLPGAYKVGMAVAVEVAGSDGRRLDAEDV
jgi:hypothetical protein